MTHDIVCSLVYMSGAGISFSGPISITISEVNRRVSACSSRRDISRGLQQTPPLAPPKGMFMRAHFHVIHMARAVVSSRDTVRLYRIPPFPGPRGVLWWARYPVYLANLPAPSQPGA